MIFNLIKKKAAEEEGVFALMTLVFFALCGLVCILIVWGIAQASSIYNIAYFSTQAAATAAVGAAEVKDKGLILRCGDPPPSSADDFACTDQGSNVYKIAVKSLNTSLAPGTAGTFGLVGPSTTNPYSGPRLTITSLQIYNISPEAGAAGRARGCSYNSSAKDAGFINNIDGASGTAELTGDLGCWRVEERGDRTFPEQYQTGLTLRTRTIISFPPFCTGGSGFCINLPVAATGAARVVQNSAPSNYEIYNCYGRGRDLQEVASGWALNDCKYDSVF